MLGLIALIVSIAVVDSVNPSTIVPALYLAGGARPGRSIVGLTAGFAAVNVAGGLLILLGPGQLAMATLPRPGATVGHVLELAVGLAALLLAAAVWARRAAVGAAFARGDQGLGRASPVVGATIAALELPTAAPYLVVLAALAGSGRALVTQAALLLLFNALFVAPLLGLAIVAARTPPAARERLSRLRGALLRRAGPSVAVALLAGGVVMLSIAAIGLLGA